MCLALKVNSKVFSSFLIKSSVNLGFVRTNNKLAKDLMFHKHVAPEYVPKKERVLNYCYGIFADVPDWSYVDGSPAPPANRPTERKAIQRQICERIIFLMNEIENAEKYIDNNKLFQEKLKNNQTKRLVIK